MRPSKAPAASCRPRRGCALEAGREGDARASCSHPRSTSPCADKARYLLERATRARVSPSSSTRRRIAESQRRCSSARTTAVRRMRGASAPPPHDLLPMATQPSTAQLTWIRIARLALSSGSALPCVVASRRARRSSRCSRERFPIRGRGWREREPLSDCGAPSSLVRAWNTIPSPRGGHAGDRDASGPGLGREVIVTHRRATASRAHVPPPARRTAICQVRRTTFLSRYPGP